MAAGFSTGCVASSVGVGPTPSSRRWRRWSRAGSPRPQRFRSSGSTTADALATWERLRGAGRGWPIVVGDNEALGILAEGWSSNKARTPATILAAADAIEFPRGLHDLREREQEG